MDSWGPLPSTFPIRCIPKSLSVKKTQPHVPTRPTDSNNDIQHHLLHSYRILEDANKKHEDDMKSVLYRLLDVENKVAEMRRTPMSGPVSREVDSTPVLTAAPPPPPPPPMMKMPTVPITFQKPPVKVVAPEPSPVAAAAEPTMVDVLKELSRVQKKVVDMISSPRSNYLYKMKDTAPPKPMASLVDGFESMSRSSSLQPTMNKENPKSLLELPKRPNLGDLNKCVSEGQNPKVNKPRSPGGTTLLPRSSH
ncbi:hypothetical protein BC829DRAFT_379170 [Chytridium lagenaria]|nr:hypothetical protein BC829DRAFT_379170 [Chytridium lagenaria]